MCRRSGLAGFAGLPGFAGLAWAALAAPGRAGGEGGDGIEAALERTVAILLERQEGLEGDARAEWPYEGVYREGGTIPIGYRVGGTAIGALALLEAPGLAGSKERREALERALRFVLAHHDGGAMAAGFRGTYDVRGWGHAYALAFLVRLRARELVPEAHRAEVDRAIARLVRTLHETEIPETGGWAYARGGGGGEPCPASPFMTAPTLLALYEAAAQGEAVDAALVERALDALEASRRENGAIPYTTAGGRDDVEGAIGRTPACEAALLLAGRGDVERLRGSVEDFLAHWRWLEERRKQTGTHAPPYGIAPYYFYYAHTYAALAIELLPEPDRAPLRARLHERLFEVREPSGGWNDRVFPRSEAYGTAMVALALLQPTAPPPARWAPVPSAPETR